MSLTDRTVKDLLAAFASAEPTPGGGSASALAGAVGASLLAMVAALPKPRAATADDAATLRTAGEGCAARAGRLTRLVDDDSRAYEQVMAAYRLPKASDAEKAVRSARIQEGLTAATNTPLEVMRECSAALDEAAVIATFGNRNASSDLQVGLELLAAGLRGAKLNVEINLDTLKDPAFVDAVRDEAAALATRCDAAVLAARARLATA